MEKGGAEEVGGDLPRQTESDLAKAAMQKSRLPWSSLQSPAWVGERHKERSGGILGKGGAVWEVAARSLHNVFLF